MAKVTKSFTFKQVQYSPGDEMDLDALELEDKNDLVARGYFTEPQKQIAEEKAEPVKKAHRSKTK